MTLSPPATSLDCFSDYVGIPFAWNGYSRRGVSCWGLVVLVYREVYGVSVPKHYEAGCAVARGSPPDSADQWLPSNIWQPIEMGQEEPGDLLHMKGVFRGRVHALHCGLVCGGGLVLHSEEHTGVHMARYKSNLFKNRVLGAYRCRLI